MWRKSFSLGILNGPFSYLILFSKKKKEKFQTMGVVNGWGEVEI